MIERAMRETERDRKAEQEIVDAVLKLLPGVEAHRQGGYTKFDRYLYRMKDKRVIALLEVKVKYEAYSRAETIQIDHTKFEALWHGDRPPRLPGLYVVAFRDPVVEQPDTIVYLDVNDIPAPVWERIGMRHMGQAGQVRPAFCVHKSRFVDIAIFPPKLS